MMRKQHVFSKGFSENRILVFLIVKRMLDIILSLFLIVLCIPVGCIVYWQLRKHKRIAVFLKQLHIGKNGKPFMRIQFRTHAYASSVIHAMPPQPLSYRWREGVPDSVAFNDEMTGVLHQKGALLRKYHLHHLPELIHVLKGDMSMVGPRPELIEIAAHYNEEQRKRLLVKPGITGTAQLNQYTHEQHKKMTKEDLFYVNTKSIWLDVKIIWFTIIHFPNRYQKNRVSLSLYNHSIGE